MNAVIADPDALRSLAPRDVAAYLIAQQWHRAAVHNGVAAIWTRAADSGEFEIEQRLDSELGDYALRTAEVLHTLSVAEGRSPLEIYRDITEAADDILRVPLDPAGSRAGTVGLAKAASATARLRELIEAAACAELEPRPAYGPRKHAQVSEYVESVALGQTEIGSFVLTLLSPLPPLRQPALPELEEPEAPFGRRALRRLARALEALRAAAATAAAGDSLAPFEQAVEHGVSANLCQAVSGLAAAAGGRLVARFSWGHTWPTREAMVRQVTLAPEAVEMAGEAATLLREQAPRDDFELEGAVVRLHRAPAEPIGTVTIRCPVEGQWRSVQLDLAEADYQLATQVHASRSLFGAVGELVRERSAYVLRNPRSVRELRDE